MCYSVWQRANVLESDVLSHLMQEDIERRDDYSRKGVEKYQNSDIEGKFATLIEMGALNADAVMDRDGDCDINKLYDAMESSKGVIVMQVATTGFDHNKPSPQLTGEPIQITAAAYPIVDGKSIRTLRKTAFPLTFRHLLVL